MKAVLFALTAFAAAALAQDPNCQANYIVEACLGQEEGKLANCGNEDWDCKCQAHVNILTCFNNCPNDDRKHSYEGQRQIFCGYASLYPSTTTKAPAATTGAKPAKTTDAKEQSTGSPSESTDATSTSTGGVANNTDKPGAAAGLVLNAGSMLAAVAAVAAAVL